MPLPSDVPSLLETRHHKPGALFVRAAGGFIDAKVAPSDELLAMYCPDGVPEKLWKAICAFTPAALDSETAVLECADLVVEALEHMVIHQVAIDRRHQCEAAATSPEDEEMGCEEGAYDVETTNTLEQADEEMNGHQAE